MTIKGLSRRTIYLIALILVGATALTAQNQEQPEPGHLMEDHESELFQIQSQLAAPDVSERLQGVRALEGLAAIYEVVPGAVRLVMELALQDTDPEVAYEATSALARFDGRAVPERPQVLGGPRPEMEIPEGVSFTNPSDWEAYLEYSSSLRAYDQAERIRGLEGLVTLAYQTEESVLYSRPAPEVLAELEALLGDNDPVIAQLALRRLDGILPTLDGKPKRIRSALGRLRSEAELDDLLQATRAESAPERYSALDRLLEAAVFSPLADDPAVRVAFELALEDRDPAIQHFAALALRGGLDGDQAALSGVWVGEHQVVTGDFTEQPPPTPEWEGEELHSVKLNEYGVYVGESGPGPGDADDQTQLPIRSSTAGQHRGHVNEYGVFIGEVGSTPSADQENRQQ